MFLYLKGSYLIQVFFYGSHRSKIQPRSKWHHHHLKKNKFAKKVFCYYKSLNLSIQKFIINNGSVNLQNAVLTLLHPSLACFSISFCFTRHYTCMSLIFFSWTFQILFISGLAFVIGLERTFRFFFQKHKLKATSFFVGGILIVLFGWPVIGMCVEMYGFFLLFR